MLSRRFGDQDFTVVLNFFSQCLRNPGNFLHALSISKKHNMIEFLTLEDSAGEWRSWSVVACQEDIRWCRLEFRG